MPRGEVGDGPLKRVPTYRRFRVEPSFTLLVANEAALRIARRRLYLSQ
jgi:hypothetical protein